MRCDAGNGISEAGAVAVAEALKENTTLTSLDLESECSPAPPLQDMMSERRGGMAECAIGEGEGCREGEGAGWRWSAVVPDDGMGGVLGMGDGGVRWRAGCDTRCVVCDAMQAMTSQKMFHGLWRRH